MKRCIIIVLSALLLAGCYSAGNKPLIPIADREESRTFIHDTELIDPWAWMRNREDTRLQKVLIDEEAYCKYWMKGSQKLAKQLYKEYQSRIPKVDESPPALHEGYYFWSKQLANQEHSVLYRQKDEPGARKEVYLDLNKLAKGHEFFDLGLTSTSPDGRLLAYTTDFSGDEVYHLWLKDLISGQTTDLGLDYITDFVWQSDNRHAIIVLDNEIMRSDRCLRLDTITTAQELLYQEPDPAFNLSIYRWGDKKTIFLKSSSKTSSQSWFLPIHDLEGGFISIAGLHDGVKYSAASLGNEIYLLTNRWTPDYSIAYASFEYCGWESWQELIPTAKGVTLENFDLFDDYLALTLMEMGHNHLAIHERKSGALIQQIIPDQPSYIELWNNPDPSAKSFSYYQESWLAPYQIYFRDFGSTVDSLYYSEPLPKGYDPSLYESHSVLYPARDGAQIPLTLIHKKGLEPGPKPLWLRGYGAYGDVGYPGFSSSLQSILDRDVIFAYAHVRGGAEMGKAWHDAGRLLNKKNSFYDFADAIDYLIREDITSSDRIIIEGGSAGGLLMGAVTNLVHTQVKAVLADVPFVDVINTMLDENLPLTVGEYEEWGNPQDPSYFKYMLSYSPYENVKPAVYPNMLITAGWNDYRVGYWESLKWAQKLRQNNLGNSQILYLLQLNEGHSGSSGRMQYLWEKAKNKAWGLSQIMNK